MSRASRFGGQRNATTASSLLVVALCGSGLLCAILYGQSSQSGSNTNSKQLALQVIVVAPPQRGNQLLEKLKAGCGFASLAKGASIDPTGDSGGVMGRVAPAVLRPEWRDALAGLGPGQISP